MRKVVTTTIATLKKMRFIQTLSEEMQKSRFNTGRSK
jgi:hypothetical protein